MNLQLCFFFFGILIFFHIDNIKILKICQKSLSHVGLPGFCLLKGFHKTKKKKDNNQT